MGAGERCAELGAATGGSLVKLNAHGTRQCRTRHTHLARPLLDCSATALRSLLVYSSCYSSITLSLRPTGGFALISRVSCHRRLPDYFARRGACSPLIASRVMRGAFDVLVARSSPMPYGPPPRPHPLPPTQSPRSATIRHVSRKATASPCTSPKRSMGALCSSRYLSPPASPPPTSRPTTWPTAACRVTMATRGRS